MSDADVAGGSSRWAGRLIGERQHQNRPDLRGLGESKRVADNIEEVERNG